MLISWNCTFKYSIGLSDLRPVLQLVLYLHRLYGLVIKGSSPFICWHESEPSVKDINKDYYICKNIYIYNIQRQYNAFSFKVERTAIDWTFYSILSQLIYWQAYRYTVRTKSVVLRKGTSIKIITGCFRELLQYIYVHTKTILCLFFQSGIPERTAIERSFTDWANGFGGGAGLQGNLYTSWYLDFIPINKYIHSFYR